MSRKTTVLLTGATGSLGASTLALLLADPSITVLAILRSLAKSAPFLTSKYSPQISSGQLSLLEIPDMTVPGAFDEPASRADAIMHIATPLAYDNLLEKLVKPSWEIVHNVLQAAEKSPRVTRVVITGSLVATMLLPRDLFSNKLITPLDFNPITLAEAESSPLAAYQYSKVHAEKMAWKFMSEQKRGFDLIFLLAPSITGRSLQERFKPEKGNLGGQPGLFMGLFDVQRPGFLFPYFADVEDVSRIHIESLSPTISGNERYLFHSPELMASNDIALAVRKEFPQLRDRVPSPEEGSGSGLSEKLVKMDTSRFDGVFGKRVWKSARVSALETVGDFVVDFEREKRKGR